MSPVCAQIRGDVPSEGEAGDDAYLAGKDRFKCVNFVTGGVTDFTDTIMRERHLYNAHNLDSFFSCANPEGIQRVNMEYRASDASGVKYDEVDRLWKQSRKSSKRSE